MKYCVIHIICCTLKLPFPVINIYYCLSILATQMKNYIRSKMYSVLKYLLKFVQKVLRLRVYEILRIIIISSIIVFTWVWLNRDIKINKTTENPVIVWWTNGFPGISQTLECENNLKCDIFSDIKNEVYDVEAYLFYASNIHFNDLPLPRRSKEIIWGLYHEESPRNVEELMHEVTLTLFNYSATFSRHSDIPFTLQYLDSLDDIVSTKYYVPVKVKNDLIKDISPVLYLQSDCETATERDAYVKELMKYIKVDSYGACLKNKEMPKEFNVDYLNNLNNGDFLRYIARYKFVIAIENGVCEDYITEKFWRAIKVGTVPIYFGSPSIKDWFPNNKSAILLEDHPTPKIMSQYLKKLLQNDTLYEEYLQHKTKEEITNKRLINEFNTRQFQTDALQVASNFECLICEKLHQKRSKENEKENIPKIVNKSHYNCPKPISALTLQVNPSNDWVFSYEAAKTKADDIYKEIIGN